MRRSFNTLTAVAAAGLTLAGCAPGNNQPPSIDGCNIPKAERQLRDRVIDGKSFTASRLGTEQGKVTESYLETSSTLINNPLILVCRGVIKAFAGINAKALHAGPHNDIDPVVVVPDSEAKNDLNVPGADGSSGYAVVSDTLRFARRDFSGDPSAELPAFTNAAGDQFGQAVESSEGSPLLVLPLYAPSSPSSPGVTGPPSSAAQS